MSGLLLLMSLLGLAGCALLYWQSHKAYYAIAEMDRDITERARIICEIIDEMTMSYQYMNREMDRCLARLEQGASITGNVHETAPEDRYSLSELPISPPSSLDAMPNDKDSAGNHAQDPNNTQIPPQRSECRIPSDALVSPVPETYDRESDGTVINSNEPNFDSYLRAIQSAAQGADLVEVARKRNLGVEELRLLLRFQKGSVFV